jgi:predicted MPP superfamily phosphohydrolase
MRFEAGFVQVKHVKFTNNKKHLKIIQLSDIHINHLKVSSKRVRHILAKNKPDLIILTGDYINKPRHATEFFKFLNAIKEDNEICLCLGNHDYGAFFENPAGLHLFMEGITGSGTKILHNSSLCIEKNSKKYNIIGFEDLNNGVLDVENVINSLDKKVFMNIAFSHNPDIVLELPKDPIDFLFCGHFHGGQIWAPFDLEFKVLRDEKLCKMGIKRGLHKVNGIKLYINRGLGNVLFPLRFLSRPEITVFYIP